MKYGIISDTHHNHKTLPGLVQALVKNNVDAIVLNGDLGDQANDLHYTVATAAKTDLPVYTQPGSHETVAAYTQVIDALKTSFSNIIDTVNAPKHEQKDHHLVFLPGSDWTAGGQYRIIGDDGIPTATFVQTQKGLILPDEELLGQLIQDPQAHPYLLHFTNMRDLDTLVTDAERTVVFCHIPAAHTNANGVDRAYFAERQDGGLVPGIALEEGIRRQYGNVGETDLHLIAARNGFTFKRENRGNAELGAAYARNGITKAINGHFHESAHNAHGFDGSVATEGTPATSLAYNASYADAGKAGIVTVRDDTISYERITL
jgi:hypothetical protein